MKAGAIEALVQHFEHPDENVQEQCIWAIRNIASGVVKSRDYILSLGVLDTVLKIVSSAKKLSMIRVCTGVIANLCGGKPQPDYKIVSTAIPTLVKLLNNTDEKILEDACYALSYMSNGSNERIADIINTNCVPIIVELLV